MVIFLQALRKSIRAVLAMHSFIWRRSPGHFALRQISLPELTTATKAVPADLPSIAVGHDYIRSESVKNKYLC